MIQARESPRIRRLRSDFKALSQLRAESSILDFDMRAALADPPHEYHIRFYGRGVWRPSAQDDVVVRETHEVSIRLGASYPRMMPDLLWRSPVFHPNISSSGVVCLGGYGTFWVPSLNLDELCVMLWDMVRYANYDVNSPYNREAALWAKTQKQFHFPFDPRPLRDRVSPTVAPLGPSIGRIDPPLPEIQFLGDVVEAEIVEAEVIEVQALDGHSHPLRRTRPEILIIE
jgi:ubiquitin-protein ligase